MKGINFFRNISNKISSSKMIWLTILKKISKILLLILFLYLIASNIFLFLKTHQLSKDLSDQSKDINLLAKALVGERGESGLAANIDELQSRLDILESTVNDNESSISDLESRVSDNESLSDENQSRIEENNSKIASIKSNLDDLEGKVWNLQSDLSDLEAEVEKISRRSRWP